MDAIMMYLPDENRIEKGNFVHSPEFKAVGQYLGGDKFINDVGLEVSLPDWETKYDFIKAIPFAVTRDVKTGDKVFCPNYLSGASRFDNCEVEGEFVHVYNDKRHISTEKKEDCYTILGKISPTATENMKLEDGKEYEMKKESGSSRYEGSPEYFQIKYNNCNTYH